MRHSVYGIAVLCASSLLALGGCGDGESTDSQVPPTSQDGGLDAEADTANGKDSAPESGPEAGPDQEAGPCTPNSQPDEPDDQGLDTNCDGADGVVGRDLYVDPKNGDDTNPGTAKLPFKTLTKAFGSAVAGKANILASAGSLSPEPLERMDAFAIIGGYTQAFVGAPERSRTVLHADAEGLRVVSGALAELRHLTIETESAVSNDQLSSHGLLLEVEEALLDDVTVRAGDALAGSAGKPGNPGQNGVLSEYLVKATCAGVEQPAYVQGAGANGSNVAGQPAGNIATKTPPPIGHPGVIGTDGLNADGKPGLLAGHLVFSAGSDGKGDGKPGTGGPGGGGNGSSYTINGQSYTITGGRGGNGGCPGGGAFRGESAGGAVAVVVLKGKLTVSRSRLATGFGGTGGDGGKGGAGGKGGPGGMPIIPGVTSPATCTDVTDPLKVNCAAYGAVGGVGGRGGTGGGGAGGWTIGVLSTGTATVDVSADTEFDLGTPGTGGMGGVVRAPDGQKAPKHHIP